MFSSELQIGIAYALLADVLWGMGPLLLKRAYNQPQKCTKALTLGVVNDCFPERRAEA